MAWCFLAHNVLFAWLPTLGLLAGWFLLSTMLTLTLCFLTSCLPLACPAAWCLPAWLVTLWFSITYFLLTSMMTRNLHIFQIIFQFRCLSTNYFWFAAVLASQIAWFLLLHTLLITYRWTKCFLTSFILITGIIWFFFLVLLPLGKAFDSRECIFHLTDSGWTFGHVIVQLEISECKAFHLSQFWLL